MLEKKHQFKLLIF